MPQNNDGFLNPETILEQLTIEENMDIADFGCGHGYFSIPLAKRVNEGKVYALDVVKDALVAIESQARIEGVYNIETVHCNLENPNGSRLKENSIDMVFLVNTLFQSQQKDKIIEEAKKVLKINSPLILIDWLEDATLAPKKGWLISKKESQLLFEQHGFHFDRDLQTDNQHFGIVFKK